MIAPLIHDSTHMQKTLTRQGLSSQVIHENNVLLKLECELPTGSYKARGISTLFHNLSKHPAKIEVISAGNLALALADECKRRNIHCTAFVPQGISKVKLESLQSLDVQIEERPFQEIWEMVDREPTNSLSPLHPFHEDLLLGYSTVALEILDEVDHLDTIVVPFGLGGLAFAVASTLRQAHFRGEILLAEIKNHAPFSRSTECGVPTPSPLMKSFVEAMGTPIVLENVYDRVEPLIDGTVQVGLDEVERAIIQLHQKHRLVVEGAAGATYAAALRAAKSLQKSKVVAILTGGNISQDIFQQIIERQTNEPADR